MTSRLVHRGPDDSGVWLSSGHPIALGNRRLSIVDLTSHGHQPMVSKDGRYALTYNGEIFNYAELSEELRSAGVQFRSRSDTEVLFEALIHWGEEALPRLRGMFAFAFWDEERARLLLVRDRLGIKPLYYAIQAGELAFASEITAILASDLITPRLDVKALRSYLRLLWVPEPGTLFAGIRKLQPACLLTWERGNAAVRPYWDIPTAEGGREVPDAAASLTVRRAVAQAVKAQLTADVPVGAFLSGGLDSTAIVAMAGESSRRDLRTYSIGFRAEDRREEGALDDVHYARMAASRLRLSHQEIVINPDVAQLLPMMVRHLEDPIADPSALNCYLICHTARSESKVLLSGTGGDELFGGYRKYVATAYGEEYQRLPKSLRRLVEPLAERLPIRIGRLGLRRLRFMKKFVKHAGLSSFDRFIGYSSYYDGDELGDLMGLQVSHSDEALLGVEPLLMAWERRASDDVVNRMTYVDMKYYLPGLGLAVMDKASMAASVEVRVPLLDDRLVEIVARYPGFLKIRGSETKRVLRHAMRGIVPEKILKRAKAPFAAPVRTWLRRDLKNMTADLLSPSRLRGRGLVNPDLVEAIIREHASGWADHSLRIWALLTLEIWLQEFIDPQPGTAEVSEPIQVSIAAGAPGQV